MRLHLIHVSYLLSAGATALAAVPFEARAGEAEEAARPGDAGQTAETGSDDGIVVLGTRETRMSQVGSTGSRLGLTVLETPASISIINGDRMRARGDQDIQAAVTRAPGLTTSANPGNGGTALALRGFSGQGSVLQLYDGLRLFPVAGTITFPVDPWTVERIEVLNGPGSVLFGQGALGGAINVIPRGPNDEHTEFEAEVGYGSQDSFHAAAGIGGPVGQALSYRLDASYRRSEGYVDRGDSKSLALSGAIRLRPSEGLAVTLRNDYGNQRPMEYFGTPLIASRLVDANRRRNYDVADASLHYRDNRTSLTADWAIGDGIRLTNAFYRLTSKRLFRNLESYFYNPASGLIDRFDNLGIIHDQVQYGNQGSIKIERPIASMSNDLVVGYDANLIKLTYSNDFGSDPQEDSVDPFVFSPGAFLDTQGIAPRFRTRTNETAFFAEDRLAVTERLSLVGGVRHERDRVERRNIVYAPGGSTSEVNAFPNGQTEKVLSNTTWRVGSVFQPNPDLSIYAQYSTGVDPLGTLTTFSPNGTQFAFTNATGNQIEAGIKAQVMGGHGNVTLAGYRIIKHKLVTQRTPRSPLEQIGQRSAKGLEASFQMQFGKRFGIAGNAAVLDADFDDFLSGGTDFGGKTPPNTPETSANLSATWRPLERLRANVNFRYVGRTWSDNANTFRVPGYAVVDAGASYAVTDNVAVGLRVFNLFNKDYATTTYNDEQWLLGRPRSVDVSASARF